MMPPMVPHGLLDTFNQSSNPVHVLGQMRTR